ncbi:MltF family protein [Alginatibacterium sediminis]|nr:transporter substrate-binding domain-containing protein [Alginatibacterium sediminis]
MLRNKTVFWTLGLGLLLIMALLGSRYVQGNDSSELEIEDPLLPDFITQPSFGDYAQMEERQMIRALVVFGRADFFMDQGHMTGLQVELLGHFETFINKGKATRDRVRIKYIPVTFDQLIPALQDGRGDIAAAFLSPTPERAKLVSLIPGLINDVDEILVSHSSNTEVTTWDSLKGKEIVVLKNSSYAENIERVNKDLGFWSFDKIKMREGDSEFASEDLLEFVNEGIIDFTVIDSYKAELWQKVLPNIQLHPDIFLSKGNSLGWAVRQESIELKEKIEAFIQSEVKPGSLLGNMLIKRYYESTSWVKKAISSSERDRLNRLMPIFEKYAQQYNFDPLVLVAQAYQESGLNNDLVSDRGAVGVMQLLPSTGAEMGIKDLSNVDQNIKAGAKYMSWLREYHLSDYELAPNEQLAFNWAIYNAGPGRLKTILKKTEELGLDPTKWFGNVELATAQIIGQETVKYVANNFKYYAAYRFILELEQQKSESTQELAEN